MKSNMTMKVEFLAGTELSSAIKESIEKCIQLNVALVEFKFNGIDFTVSENADINLMLEEYNKKDHRYGIVG